MPTPMVRTYTAEDHDAVVGLWSTVFPEDPAWNESKALIATKLTVQPELFFVCELEGQIVGTTIAGFDGVRGWVHKVACAPELRRSGIAKNLMDAAENALRELGCVKLNLQVRKGNDQAIRFYEQLGFQPEERTSLSKNLS